MNEHLGVLSGHYDMSGKSVCDIGAGDGAFAASMVKLGAIVTAVEIDDVHVSAIRQVYGDTMSVLLGGAEKLPLPNGSIDLACFMFSLHHVPLDYQQIAVCEIKRVLRPGGRLHVAEPKPFGQLTEVLMHVDDETEVRTVSQNRMDELSTHEDFDLVSKDEYTLTRNFTDFDQLVSKLVMNDPARAGSLPSVRDKMETIFLKLSKKTENGWSLNQPCVSYHFKKLARA